MDQNKAVNFLILFALAFLVSVVLTPVFRALAHRLKIIDRPGPRKIHKKNIAYLGGLSFYFSLVVVLSVVRLYFPEYWQDRFVALVIGSLLIVLLGLYDDVIGASAWIKLPCQFLIAGFMYYYGFSIDRLSNPFDYAGSSLELTSIGMVVTMFWYAAMMNGVNLIDGLDGLAAGVIAVAAASLFVISWTDMNLTVALVSLVLLGGCLGFLLYNFPPASIFMGDTGSLLLGFLMASASILGESKGSTLVTMAIPMVAVGISLLDTGLAFIRRAIQGKNPFRADQLHLHHRLLRLGLSQRQVVIIIYYCSILFGMTSYLLSQIEIRYSLLTILILVMALLLGIRMLDFVESLIETRLRKAGLSVEENTDR
jgi:UDP-GlcNAc:undecaprenyl-phosphate/decaprenyl-phosphate GlcNAc-1-phosphate transferase